MRVDGFSKIDVLILGAGPAGLMCANALSRAGISVRIVDKRYVVAVYDRFVCLTPIY